MEKVDCIVVGGGLAGLAAAYGLAAEGLEVMVLERGNYAGAKNVTGGRLYMDPIRALYPELWAEAPFERAVARESITMMGDGAHTTVEVASDRFAGAQPQSYTVLRARFDQWFADKAAEKGAMIVPNMKVDELLREGGGDGRPGRVIGIRAGGDEIGADVTIVAEGVLGTLASAAGLRAEPAARDSALGFKEVIELPAAVIEDRWRLNEGEGAAHLFMGTVTRGMLGGGFVYTNKESISVGVVVGMAAMLNQAEPVESYKLLDEFKELPQIAPLVKGGTVAEYSAHAIAEGGIARVPKLFGDGYLLAGDAAGLSLNALVTVRGMDFAIASGYHAARAVVATKKAGDTSVAGLARYERALRDSFVLKDLETSRAIPRIVENPRLFTHYPQAVSKLAESVFTIGPQPSPRLARTVWKGARRDFLSLATLKDLWSLRKM
jgi:electron transfer flavoprotein-quinone oxidoreductase